jgi:PhnB protein
MSIKGARPNNRQVAAHLFLQNVDGAAAFYGKAFGAVELYRSTMPNGTVVHAQVKIGDSVIGISREHPEIEQALVPEEHRGIRLRAPEAVGVTGVVLEMYVDDVDAVYQRAVDAGAEPRIRLADTFFGDRYCQVTDPFGHVWALATVLEELTPDEVERRMMRDVPDFPKMEMEN